MPKIKYCNYCASSLKLKLNQHDHVSRLTCPDCNEVVYENPKILVSCFVTWGQKVLWMKRATQPYKGLWSLPGGFMEIGESPRQAAARELFEETRAEIDPDTLQLYEVGYVSHINQVYLVYRGTLNKPDYQTSHEAEEVALFSELEVPWESFANPEIETSMRYFYRDLAQNDYGVYEGQLCDGIHVIERVSSI